MIRPWWIAVLVLSLCMMAPAAWAQSCSGSMANMNFGSFSSISPAGATATGNVNINCSGFATPYARVCVSMGLPANSGTWSARTLPGPSGATLSWTIYQDADFTKPWTSVYDQNGIYANYVDIPLSSGTGAAVLPYYAKVPGNQGVPAGGYAVTFGTNDAMLSYAGFSSNPPACTTALSSAGRFTFTVNATVISDCLISATNIDFGQVGLITIPANSTGTITTTCNKTTAYSVSLDAGAGAGSSVSSRKLTRNGGNETLAYALYTDAARTRPWGDGSSGTTTVSGTGNGAAQTSTIYASLLAPAAVPAGVYVDTVIATVTY
ncbi:Spore coat protein U (SCPU) domain-containing protein [Dyella jiangningensis]|uniref:Csu type fimbrial protein n=1 Tax=Dyella sp. AtDHG13 TaxID=1938897 RepID=UPI00088F06BD|nr:spore coat protein U domain-containing protein [Dyella sp. AtDHG13]PXV54706.1 spore coat protein U-like protein [Dyella sp. AtDHG13]SDK87964.1 Spore coat protein U (SCPU) domain-containing protein [Dyella jiangningensis]